MSPKKSPKIVRAFAPANIACVTKMYTHKNPRWAGSTGYGFTLNKGVTVSVAKAEKTQVFFNRKPIHLPTVSSVLDILGVKPLKVLLESDFPLGCGFGISGAAALASAYAINKLFNLKKPKKELAIIAHTAEAQNKTGLSDVLNQFYGGFYFRTKPSSSFVAKKINFGNTYVYCRVFSKLLTKDVLQNKKVHEKINRAADIGIRKMKALRKKKQKITFGETIAIAREFIFKSGMLTHKQTKKTIEQVTKKGGEASMLIWGNAVYSNIPFPGARKFKISNKGAHLLRFSKEKGKLRL